MELQINEKEFLVLNHLDIFRFIIDIDPVQKSMGLGSEEIVACLLKFKEEGIVLKEMYEGRERWKITPMGEKVAFSYRQFILAKTGQKEAIIKKCEEFEDLNVKLKELVTNWQMKSIDGIPIINDHSDPEYDSAILKQIFDLHENVIKTLEEMASIILMYKNYIKRLDLAIKKLREGEFNYLIKNKDSYHNVWFELHESILKLWGRERME